MRRNAAPTMCAVRRCALRHLICCVRCEEIVYCDNGSVVCAVKRLCIATLDLPCACAGKRLCIATLDMSYAQSWLRITILDLFAMKSNTNVRALYEQAKFDVCGWIQTWGINNNTRAQKVLTFAIACYNFYHLSKKVIVMSNDHCPTGLG